MHLSCSGLGLWAKFAHISTASDYSPELAQAEIKYTAKPFLYLLRSYIVSLPYHFMSQRSHKLSPEPRGRELDAAFLWVNFKEFAAIFNAPRVGPSPHLFNKSQQVT